MQERSPEAVPMTVRQPTSLCLLGKAVLVEVLLRRGRSLLVLPYLLLIDVDSNKQRRQLSRADEHVKVPGGANFCTFCCAVEPPGWITVLTITHCRPVQTAVVRSCWIPLMRPQSHLRLSGTSSQLLLGHCCSDLLPVRAGAV